MQSDKYIDQISLVCAITKELNRQNISGCNSRQLNCIIECANRIIEEFGKPTVLATPGMGLDAWLNTDDTGMSSLYMAHIFYGIDAKFAEPLDAGDFGRCSRFLKATNSISMLDKMRNKSKYWEVLVVNWPEMEVILEHSDGSKLTDWMQRMKSSVYANA